MRRFSSLFLTLLFIATKFHAQPVPAEVENIPYLMVFGPKAESPGEMMISPKHFFFKYQKTIKIQYTLESLILILEVLWTK